MRLLTRLAAVIVAGVLDAQEAILAELQRIRDRENSEPLAEPEHEHRFDPASTTSCLLEQADGSEPYSAYLTAGDIPREPPGFGFTQRPRRVS